MRGSIIVFLLTCSFLKASEPSTDHPISVTFKPSSKTYIISLHQKRAFLQEEFLSKQSAEFKSELSKTRRDNAFFEIDPRDTQIEINEQLATLLNTPPSLYAGSWYLAQLLQVLNFPSRPFPCTISSDNATCVWLAIQKMHDLKLQNNELTSLLLTHLHGALNTDTQQMLFADSPQEFAQQFTPNALTLEEELELKTKILRGINSPQAKRAIERIKATFHSALLLKIESESPDSKKSLNQPLHNEWRAAFESCQPLNIRRLLPLQTTQD